MSVSKFLGALKGGGARPNRFEILINFPAFAANAETARKTSVLVQSTSLPGSNLGVIEQFFRGRPIKLAGDRTFDEWEATFVNDTDFAIRNALEAWSNGVNSYNSNLDMVPEEYMSTINIWQLDGHDRRIKEYALKYAWPSVVAPVELAQDSNDQLELFSVTFAYSDIFNGFST